MCLFHKWTKWEQYIERGTKVLAGLFVPKEVIGTTLPYSERRQKRHCLKCNKEQDELIIGS
jgi:hypothetical protein